MRCQHAVRQSKTSSKDPLSKRVARLVNLLVHGPVDGCTKVLHGGARRVELDTVLVHHCSGVRLPGSSSPLGGSVLCGCVTRDPQDVGAEGLDKVRELTVELAAVVAQNVNWDSERESTTSC